MPSAFWWTSASLQSPCPEPLRVPGVVLFVDSIKTGDIAIGRMVKSGVFEDSMVGNVGKCCEIRSYEESKCRRQ